MQERIELHAHFPVCPERLFDELLDGEKHSALTGGLARISARNGEAFSAWDGYISGRNMELDRPNRIVQAWRTTDFPEDAPDSCVEWRLAAADGGTDLTLVHTNLPDSSAADYRQGWMEFYFTPMQEYYTLHP